jgi:4-hydroxybenzoyl-CoA reductase subunit beta
MSLSLPDFTLARPREIQAAIAARGRVSTSRFLAGGTDLIVNLRRGLDRPSLLIDLTGIGELRELSMAENGLRLGACVTLADLVGTPGLQNRYRAVAEAAAHIASPGTRSLATVGGNLCLQTRCIYYNQSEWWRRANRYCLKHQGNICHVAPQGQHCHAVFSGDLAPALLVLDAEVELAGETGRRRLPLADFYREDGRDHLVLDPDEILVAVQLPPDPPPSGYAKARVRGAIDFPLAGAAVALTLKNGRLTLLRVGLTGTNSRPFLLQGAEALLGRALDEDALRRLDNLVQQQVQPVRTTTVSAYYRRLVAAALVRKVATALAAQSDITL